MILWALALFFFFFRYFADKGKMSKFSKVITQKIFFFTRIYSEVNQIIYSFILPINLPSFKALAPTVFFFFFLRFCISTARSPSACRPVDYQSKVSDAKELNSHIFLQIVCKASIMKP